MALGSGSVRIKPIPRFPAIERDLSIVVAEPVTWAEIARAVKEAAPAELEDIRFVDIYRGKGITPGAKSVTLSLSFRDEDGTLTHETVDKYQAAILEASNTPSARSCGLCEDHRQIVRDFACREGGGGADNNSGRGQRRPRSVGW